MGLYEDGKDFASFWMFGGGAVILCIIALFMWMGGCLPTKEEREPTKVEKTLDILDKKWDQWIDKND